MRTSIPGLGRGTRHVALILWAVCLLCGCDLQLPGERDDLTFEQEPYLGDALRMDGFYYTSYVAPDGEGPYYTVHFFYRNGVVRYAGTFESIESLGNEDFLDGDRPWHWGRFRVEGTRVAFERWYPGAYATAYVHSGEILSDTTFIVTELQRSNGDDVRSEDETHTFRRFRPKPDSTSRYLD